jgi:6-phosphofructokinase 1
MAYVRPLIGEDWPSVPMINGRQRFSQLEMKFAPKKLSDYKLEAFDK